jgi:hypothetical protein
LESYLATPVLTELAAWPAGSVDGSIQPAGAALARYGTMPVATLRVDGERVCASLPRAAIHQSDGMSALLPKADIRDAKTNVC